MNQEILTRSYIAGGYFDNKIHLVYRDEFNKKRECSFTQRREVFIKTKDEVRLPRSTLYRRVKALSREGDGRYTRLEVGWKEEYDEFSRLCRGVGIEILEGDVRPLRRVFADHDLKVTTNWNCLFLDLETEDNNPNFNTKETWRILSCSFKTLEGRSFHFVTETICDSAEKELLLRILKVIISYDVILAWNGDNFDFPMLVARCKYHDIDFPWWKVNLLDMLKVYKKYSGRDDIKTSFKLDDVGENVVGIGKIKRESSIIEMVQYNRKLLQEYNDRDVEIMVKLELVKGFVALHLRICAICHTFPGRTSLFSSELMDGLMLRRARDANFHYPTRTSYEEIDDSAKFEGAYVMEPVVGFHQGVSVFDFASLYPSIIISFNMSPDTVLKATSYPRKCENCGSIDPPGIQYKCKHCRRSIISSPFADPTTGEVLEYSTAPTGISFSTDKIGLVPEALIELINERNKVKKQMKGVQKGTQEYLDLFNKSTALKVLANSFYGQLGAPFTRYYVREVAESVTLTAQHFIKLAITSFTERGKTVVYGDTDSCFVQGEPEELKSIVNDLNSDVFIEEMKKMNCRDFLLNFSYEKRYKNYLIAAKKNYAGWIEDMEGDVPKPHKKLQDVITRWISEGFLKDGIVGTLDVKGLEMMRGDRIAVTRELQQLFILMLVRDDILDSESLMKVAKQYRLKFETGNGISLDDIVIAKSISKDPDSYAGNLTVHVRLAKEMKNNGMEVFPGMKIRYIVTDGSKSPNKAIRYEEFNGDWDRVYYWNKQVWPPAVRVLGVAVSSYPWGGFTLKGKGGCIQTDFDFFKNNELPSSITRKKPGVPRPAPRVVIDHNGISKCIVYLGALRSDADNEMVATSRARSIRECVEKSPGTTELIFNVFNFVIDEEAESMREALQKSKISKFLGTVIDDVTVIKTPYRVDYSSFSSSLIDKFFNDSFFIGVTPIRVR